MAPTGVTEVGKYRVVDQIGEGAMGVVYRALDPVLNRPVAIKVMSDSLARDDELRGRFLREAQAAGSLQHPNLVTIYDFGEVGGHLFIAMEFVEGEDLDSLMRRKAPVSLSQKVDILVDVLGGLAYAHKRGIVHRDVKPANIRIDVEGRARVMDFGIAHLQSSTMTRTGLRVGTPAYMAPEQVSGDPITPATDIFSVGAVMYELLTGKKAFEGESLQSVFFKIVGEDPPDLTIIKPSLPPALNPIARRSLAKHPGDRYPTALEMANALTEARASLEGVSSQPKAVSLRSSIESGLRKGPGVEAKPTRRPLVLGAGALGLIAIVAVGSLVFRRGATHDATVPGPPIAPVRVAPAQGGGQPVTVDPKLVSPPSKPAAAAPVIQNSATPSVRAKGSAAPPTRSAATNAPAEKAAPKSLSTQHAVGPSKEELDLLRSLQATALDARRRAADAGATAAQLQSGDDHEATASTLVQQGKITEAAAHLTLATNAWSSAERDARAAAAAAAAAARRRTETPRQESIVAIPRATAAPVSVQPSTPRIVTPDPSAEVQSVVGTYARAIESRDLSQVRRAYPGITRTQADGFDQFFGSVRSLRVTFTTGSIDIKGDAAEAHVEGTYDYVTTDGKSKRDSVPFQASFHREGAVWKLVSVH